MLLSIFVVFVGIKLETMAKDPAFLFYSDRFVSGVQTMNWEDRGKYITLLALMHQQGRLSEETICFLVGSVSDKLKSKFKVDELGLWYNETLEVESDKRRKFVESRALNGSKGGRTKKDEEASGKAYEKHMANLPVIVNVIKDLNNILNTKYSDKSKKTLSLINSRIEEGFVLEDFKTVVEFKFKQWGNDEKMKEYLRPETLFGSKFESYLQTSKPNQQPRTKKPTPLITTTKTA